MKQRPIATFAAGCLAGGLALAWHHERERPRSREEAGAREFETLKAKVEETRQLLEATRQQLRARAGHEFLVDERRPPIDGELREDRPWVAMSLKAQTVSDWAFQDSTRSGVVPPQRFHDGDFPTRLERSRLVAPTGSYLPMTPP